MGWFAAGRQAGEQSLLVGIFSLECSGFFSEFSPDFWKCVLWIVQFDSGWGQFGGRPGGQAGRQSSNKASVGFFSEFSPDLEVRLLGLHPTWFGYVAVRLGLVRSFENRL